MIDVSTIQQSALMMIASPVIALWLSIVAISIFRYIISK
jgi:hypothetical protein